MNLKSRRFSHDRGKAKKTAAYSDSLTKKLKSRCNRVRHRENVPSILGFKPDPRESWFENAIYQTAAVNWLNRWLEAILSWSNIIVLDVLSYTTRISVRDCQYRLFDLFVLIFLTWRTLSFISYVHREWKRYREVIN